MANSTAPVLIAGGIELASDWLNSGQFEVRVLVAAGIAAGGLALVEQVPGMAPVASGIAWIALVTLLLTRRGGKPSPIETLGKATGL